MMKEKMRKYFDLACLLAIMPLFPIEWYRSTVPSVLDADNIEIFFQSINGMRIFTSVSYTHLDVYKRQMMLCKRGTGWRFILVHLVQKELLYTGKMKKVRLLKLWIPIMLRIFI